MTNDRPLDARPIMLATQLVKAIDAGDPSARLIARAEDPETVLDGLAMLSNLLAVELAKQTGATVASVLDGIHETSLAVVGKGAATG